MLRLGDVDQHELYDAMDWLLRRQPGIEQRLARRHLQENTLVLYDLTSTYVEGTHCPLARRGYSRDGKKDKLQIVFGLRVCSPEGCPIAVEVFEGNTSDPKTVACQVDKLRLRFGLARLVLVGDRGMLTAARIREDLASVEGLRWITSLRAPAIRKLIADETVHPSLGSTSATSPKSPATTSPANGSSSAATRGSPPNADGKRLELLAATEKLLEPIAQATRRPKRPLRGKDAIGIRVGKVIDRYKVAKHFDPQITEDSFSFERIHEQIAAEEQLDGIYVIRSNVEPERLDAARTVRAYKSLSRVERAFRCLKSVDLKVRPILSDRRPRPHPPLHARLLRRQSTGPPNITLGPSAANASRMRCSMNQADLAPLLFDDHDPDTADSLRTSVVQPAQRSPAARNKAARKRTHDDLPVHSFRSLLSELGTFTANTMRIPGTQNTFTQHPEPTPVQKRSSELLGVSLLL